MISSCSCGRSDALSAATKSLPLRRSPETIQRTVVRTVTRILNIATSMPTRPALAGASGIARKWSKLASRQTPVPPREQCDTFHVREECFKADTKCRSYPTHGNFYTACGCTRLSNRVHSRHRVEHGGTRHEAG